MRDGIKNGLTARAVERAEALCPPVPAMEALANNFLYAMIQEGTPARGAKIANAMYDKAESGDVKAAQYCLAMNQAARSTPSAPKSELDILEDAFRVVFDYLMRKGPKDIDEVLERMGWKYPQLKSVMSYRPQYFKLDEGTVVAIDPEKIIDAPASTPRVGSAPHLNGTRRKKAAK